MPDAEVTLEAPTLLGTADLAVHPRDVVAARLARATDRPATRVGAPWRSTPEGLTVFLI